MRDAHMLAAIPGVMVHGRYDIICPLENAWELHQAWPGARLRIINDAGHAASEPGILSALVEETEKMADLLTND